MMNLKIPVLLALMGLLLLGSSCKTRKGMIKTRHTDTVQSDQLIDRIRSQALSFRSIEIRSSTRAEMDGTTYALSITYRNVPDSAIWISVRALLGIEVLRIYGTPEEVAVYSRMADLKEKGDWKAMKELLGYPVDFYSMQGLMNRQLFYPGQPGSKPVRSFVSNSSSNGILLVRDVNMKQAAQDKDVPLPAFLIHPEDYSIKTARLSPENNAWQLEVAYGDEYPGDLYGYPSEYRISAIDSDQQMVLSLKIQAVKLNEELKMPYAW